MISQVLFYHLSKLKETSFSYKISKTSLSYGLIHFRPFPNDLFNSTSYFSALAFRFYALDFLNWSNRKEMKVVCLLSFYKPFIDQHLLSTYYNIKY